MQVFGYQSAPVCASYTDDGKISYAAVAKPADARDLKSDGILYF